MVRSSLPLFSFVFLPPSLLPLFVQVPTSLRRNEGKGEGTKGLGWYERRKGRKKAASCVR
jgi:hypothetical protein